MTDKEQIIEYPHCQSCLEYNICKAKGLNRYEDEIEHDSDTHLILKGFI